MRLILGLQVPRPADENIKGRDGHFYDPVLLAIALGVAAPGGCHFLKPYHQNSSLLKPNDSN